MDIIIEVLRELKPECNFSSSGDFVADGLLDSFDVIALVSELEERFHILIDSLDILPENFSSADAIAALVKKNGGTLA